MKIFFITNLLCLFILSACSTTPEPKKKSRHYSEETLDFFNKVETTNTRIREVQVEQRPTPNKRSDNLDSFESIENVRIDSMPAQQTTREVERTESYTPPVKNPPIQQMSENERQKTTNNQIFAITSNESLVEIEQHVSYYCMNKKNIARFKNSPELCQRYTNAVLAKCIPNKKVVNRNNVACVLKYLKR